MKNNTHTFQILLSIICILAAPSLGYSQTQETINGPLVYMEAKNGETFLAIDSTKKLVTKGDDGALLESKLIQIAGLDERRWQEALKLVGKNVSATGRPMGALTQHHFTPVLLITDKVVENNNPVIEDDPQLERPRLNDPRGSKEKENQESGFSKEW